MPSEMKRLRQLEEENGKLISGSAAAQDVQLDIVRRIGSVPGVGGWNGGSYELG
jgi:hypothetical protein